MIGERADLRQRVAEDCNVAVMLDKIGNHAQLSSCARLRSDQRSRPASDEILIEGEALPDIYQFSVYELGKLLGQFQFSQDFPVFAPHTMLSFQGDGIGALQVLVPPPLIMSKVPLGTMVSEDLHCPFGAYGKILFADMAPNHIRVV